MKPWNTLALALAATFLSEVAEGQKAGVDEFYVRSARIYLGDGREVEDGVLYVRDGVIQSVGRGVAVPSGKRTLQHDGVLTPGIISCASNLGLAGESGDSARADLSEGRLADAYQPSHTDYAHALEFGVTTTVLTPSISSVVGGSAVVVKTDGSEVLDRDSHLVVSFSTPALQADRAPTGYAGALALLEEHLASPTGVWAEAEAGRLPLMMHAGPRHEVARAIAFATQHGLQGSLIGAAWADDVLESLRASGLSVVVGPFRTGTSPRTLDTVVSLAEAGIPFAFAAEDSRVPTDPVRFSVALCVRRGLDESAARKALFGGAALIAGVADRVGTLERGKDADFILWDGDPLDLTSSPRAIYVKGRLVTQEKH